MHPCQHVFMFRAMWKSSSLNHALQEQKLMYLPGSSSQKDMPPNADFRRPLLLNPKSQITLNPLKPYNSFVEIQSTPQPPGPGFASGT